MKSALSLTLSLFVSLIITKHANSQDSAFVKTTFKGDFGQYFGRKLKFPMDLAFKGIDGFVEVELRVNRNGNIDSLEVITAPHPNLASNIIEVLISSKNMWTATESMGNKIDFKYKFVVQYVITEKGSGVEQIDPSEKLYKKALKEHDKERFDEGLSSINRAILNNPYKPDYYKLRYELLSALGDTEKSEMDRVTSERLKLQLLDIITIVAFGIKR